jgi:uncharacterized protein YndB with AHSA1/START domain
MLAAPLRSRQSVTIDAPLEAVWEYNSDLSRIADFHPRVDKVDLIDGQSQRAAGVGYKCHLRGGRHTCVERDIEVVPMERIVTTLPEDSFGVARLLPDYRVETTLEREGVGRTRVEFRHYYSIRGWKARLFHWIAGRRIAKESQATLDAIKRAVEAQAPKALPAGGDLAEPAAAADRPRDGRFPKL